MDADTTPSTADTASLPTEPDPAAVQHPDTPGADARPDGLDAEIRQIAECVDRTRRTTAQVRDWWQRREAEGAWAERFDLVREFNPGDHSFGFFDRAAVDGRDLPLMGCVQEMFYDRQKKALGADVRDQLREFVLGYFMRVSHLREPQVAVNGGQTPPGGLMRMLSWMPEPADSRVGFGYEQLALKRHDSEEVHAVPPGERGAIVDLRTIGPVFDWVAMRVNIFDFNLGMAPLGPEGVRMNLPLKEVTYLLMTPEGVIDRERPSAGVLGEYGFSYGLLPYTPDAGIFAYGPGHFAAGYQSIVFQVLEDGAIRVRAVFVVNRPDKVLSVDVDPVGWSFRLADMMTFNLASRAMAPMKAVAERLPLRLNGVDPVSLYISAANLLSGGFAERRLGISKVQLEKLMLVQHFRQHYEMLLNSLLVWRMVPDWTRHESLPDFCARGLAD